MTYSKLGNIKGPQGRRGLNMTGGATTPPAVDDSVLEGDLWLDSTTGDVYRATTPDPAWAKDGTWNEWGTVLWKAADNTLMVQPKSGDEGVLGDGPSPWQYNPNINQQATYTSVMSRGRIILPQTVERLFASQEFADLSAIGDWDASGCTSWSAPFHGLYMLIDASFLAQWDVSGLPQDNLNDLFSSRVGVITRFGIPSYDHGGLMVAEGATVQNGSTPWGDFITGFKDEADGSEHTWATLVADMRTNPSKYSTGHVYTVVKA